MKIEMSCVKSANVKILITCFFQFCDNVFWNTFVTLFFFFLQISFRSDYLFHLFYRSMIRRILLIETSIIEQIIIEVEMIETNAIIVKISMRRSRKRRRCMKKSKWKSWWESWWQQNVKNAWFFVWWKDRFLWQNKAIERYRFRERMLLKSLRFWTFQILTNQCLLIDCKQKVCDDAWLICRWKSRLTNINALRKRTTNLMLMQT